MPKRKRNESESDDYEALRKKVKEIEKKLRSRSKKSRKSRSRRMSSDSSLSRDSPERQFENNDCEVPSPVTRRYWSIDNDGPVDAENHSEPFPTSALASPAGSVQAAAPDADAALRAAAAAATVAPGVAAATPSHAPMTASAGTSAQSQSPNDATPELDEATMEILGIDPTQSDKFGKDIQKDLAVRFEHGATSGLTKENRKELTDKYLVPGNCKLIDAPTLNPEVKAALSEAVLKRDKAIEMKQKLMSSALSSLGEAITQFLTAKERNPNLLRLLMDTGRMLCDCQHNDTVTRRNYVIYSVKKEMKEYLQNTKVDNYLFGQNLSDTLKTAKAIHKSGAELKTPVSKAPVANTKKATPFSSKNWKSNPPRKQPATTYTKTKETTAAVTTRAPRAGSSKQWQGQRSAQNRR